jgi:hypothetical protein
MIDQSAAGIGTGPWQQLAAGGAGPVGGRAAALLRCSARSPPPGSRERPERASQFGFWRQLLWRCPLLEPDLCNVYCPEGRKGGKEGGGWGFAERAMEPSAPGPSLAGPVGLMNRV